MSFKGTPDWKGEGEGELNKSFKTISFFVIQNFSFW